MAKVLSIEVGTVITKICSTEMGVRNPKVHKCVTIPTPEGAIRDGELMPIPQLAEALNMTIAENKMQCKQVVFVVSSTRIASREVTIPFVKEKKIPALVKAGAGDYFPIELDQYVLGYIVMGTVEEGENKGHRLMVLAIPRTMVEGYRDLALMCGMQLAALDYAGNSIYQVVRREDMEGLHVVIKVDDRSSILTIMENRSIVLQRNIAYGVSDALHVMMEQPIFGVRSEYHAYDMVRHRRCLKLNQQDVSSGEEYETDELASGRAAVSGALGMLVNGIARVLDFYATRNGGKSIEKVYLTGMGAGFSGLGKFLSRELGMQVRVLNRLDGLASDKAFRDEIVGEYMACMGAVMSPVGFLDAEIKKGRKTTESKDVSYRRMGGMLLAGGILIAIALVLVSNMQYQEARLKVREEERRIGELAAAQQIYNEYEAVSRQHGDIKNMYAMTENYNEQILNFIAELEAKMPSNIHVSSFSATKETVSMNMTVVTKEEMANALQALRGFESLQDVTVAGMQDSKEDGGVREVSFSVVCTYKAREAAQASGGEE